MYLNCKTFYSFRYGTYSTEALVGAAIENGVTSLGLTNINSTWDVWEFVKLCNEAEIKPIVGVEVHNESKPLYLLIAASNKGLYKINEFLSAHIIPKQPFPELLNSLFENESDGFVIYPLDFRPLNALQANEFIGVLPWEVNKLYTLDLKKYQHKFIFLCRVSQDSAVSSSPEAGPSVVIK